MKYPTPYGKAEELAHQNERLTQALRRERRALAAERARIQAVLDVLDRHEFDPGNGSEMHVDADRIRRALDAP